MERVTTRLGGDETNSLVCGKVQGKSGEVGTEVDTNGDSELESLKQSDTEDELGIEAIG